MHPHPGTYALIFLSSRPSQLIIGRLGTLHLKTGFYVYVGSAFGPGGLKARIAHHRRRAVRPHWHIDYLASSLMLTEIWFTYDPVHREHQWAEIISNTRGVSVPLAGFGSSDCRCEAHLFYCDSRPSGQSFRRKVHAGISNHSRILINNSSNVGKNINETCH